MLFNLSVDLRQGFSLLFTCINSHLNQAEAVCPEHKNNAGATSQTASP